MAMASIAHLLFLLSIVYVAGKTTASTTQTSTNGTTFIETSCKSTLYPTVCVESLSPYASEIQQSPRQMALVALSVSLSRSKSAELHVLKLKELNDLKPREYQPTKDCLNLMIDSVDRISQSVQEWKGMGETKGKDFSWHMSNVQTWVSAALTDDTTCLDGFADKALDGKVKDSIRANVVDVARVTSNALALVNRCAKMHDV